MGEGMGWYPVGMRYYLIKYFSNFGSVKTMNFWKKRGGHANPNEFCCKLSGLPKKYNIVFQKGGSEAVWKFSENSSNLVQLIVP